MAAQGVILDESLTLEDYQVDIGKRPTIAHDEYNGGSFSIPCIDLSHIQNSTPIVRTQLLQDMRKAVSEWGFFQVIGHGVDIELLEETMGWARKVFDMPFEEKLKVAVAEGSHAGYDCGSLKVRSGMKIWQESLQSWADPNDFKAIADKLWSDSAYSDAIKKRHHEFAEAVKGLGIEIYHLLEEALGLNKDDLMQYWESSKGTFIRFNHYPPCEQPDTVNGSSPHRDPGLITILYQDDIGGLQIFRDGQWIACKPRRDAFVINIGDCLQVLSNDIFPSVLHRVVTNKYNARLSVAAFTNTKLDAEIKPVAELVDAQRPAKFRSLSFQELFKVFMASKDKNESMLNGFRLQAAVQAN